MTFRSWPYFPGPPTSKTKFQVDKEPLTGIALSKPALASTQPPSGSSGMDTDSGSPFYGGNVKLEQLPMKTMTKRPTISRPTSAIVHVPEPFPRRGSLPNDANSGLYPTILRKRKKKKKKKKKIPKNKERGLLSFYAIRRPSGRCFPLVRFKLPWQYPGRGGICTYKNTTGDYDTDRFTVTLSKM